MRICLAVLMALLALPASAASMSERLLDIQHRWAEIQYRLDEDKRLEAFEELAAETKTFVADYPDRAEPLIWRGIVLSTRAGAEGGFSALSLVGTAREALEKALEIDPEALAGSAHTSLGSLYYQVPSWPLSFGDDEQARKHLRKALAINPDGIDPNYFFGDFLVEQGEEKRARTYLERALNAPERPDRPVADKGRRQEIRALLETL
ncbi:tetratricopeptide repeat protein [Salicola sp. Rm-C-2C1-2]|uniref:tetratricopeptide repeat protein n=1 Tax=Salicola sp. Rm-C-2C1-2 TaxID=3141321 RepID=UPI0032E4A10E